LSGLRESKEGLAADGVSKLVVRAWLDIVDGDPLAPPQFTFVLTDESETVSPLPAPEQVGALYDPAHPPADDSSLSNCVTVDARQNADGDWLASCIVQAPLDYIRTDVATDADNPTRNLTVKLYDGALSSLDAQQEVAGQVTVRLHRPPVFLVHGIWGATSKWGWRAILKAKGYAVHEIIYTTDDAYFDDNVSRVAAGIVYTIIDYAATHNIVATQADVFAHSMGGILCRLCTTDAKVAYRRTDNYGAGDMHKLVVVNSPQFGSELANLLIDENEQKTQLGYLFDMVYNVDGGGVYDLRVNSAAIDELLSLPSYAPVHAMYSMVDPVVFWDDVGELLQVLLLRLLCGMGINDAFNGNANDTIVNVISQKAGLEAKYLSEIEGDKRLHTGDNGVKMSTYAADIAVALLEAPVNDDNFRMDGFPITAIRLAEPPVCDSPLILPYPLDGLVISIVVPDDVNDSTSYPSGDAVVVQIAPVNGFVPEYVILSTSPEAEVVYSGLVRAEVTIPLTHVGHFEIKAHGFNSDYFCTSNKLTLVVVPPADLEGLSLDVAEVVLSEAQPEYQVHVIGSFADDIERDLTDGSTGITYLIENEAVATVEADGLVVAQSVGQTLLLVTYEDHMVAVPIIVQSVKSD